MKGLKPPEFRLGTLLKNSYDLFSKFYFKNCVRILTILFLVTFIKTVETRPVLGSLIKQGQKFLDAFLSQGKHGKVVQQRNVTNDHCNLKLQFVSGNI